MIAIKPYIDELLMMANGPIKYYLHDHLYSPVALVGQWAGGVIERYEYDAYGNCTIRDASYEIQVMSSNLYAFCSETTQGE